jgi:hypothetical protein
MRAIALRCRKDLSGKRVAGFGRLTAAIGRFYPSYMFSPRPVRVMGCCRPAPACG